MAELRHNSEVESTPKTESSEPSGKKVSSEVQEANQSELKPKQTESKESKKETTEKKTDTPPKEEPLEKKETTVEVPQETKPQEEEKKRPAEDVPLRTETPSVDAEKGNGKLTKEETEALKDKIRADIDSMKESPSGYKDFENGVRDVPTDQPAKLSSKNFDRLAEERGLSPEEAKAQKESFRAFPEQDKSLNNASHHPEKTSADEATIRHVTKDEPVNVYSNEKGASGKYSTHDVYTEPSEVQKNLATPDYNTGEYTIYFCRYGYWDGDLWCDEEPHPNSEHWQKYTAFARDEAIWDAAYPHLKEYTTWEPGTEQCYPHYCNISGNIFVDHKPIDIYFDGLDPLEPRFCNRMEANLALPSLEGKAPAEWLPGFAELPVAEMGLRQTQNKEELC